MAEVRYDFQWNRHQHIQRYSRTLPAEQELFFVQEPYTPAPVNWGQGLPDSALRAAKSGAGGSYYPPERIAAMRTRLAGVDRKAYLRDILAHLGCEKMNCREIVTAVCGFINQALYYNPTQLPREEGLGDLIVDPVELLELHDGRCGQGVAVTVALLAEAGIEARTVPVHHHVTCEAFYDNAWRLADALMFGTEQPTRDGEVPSVAALQAEPYLADAFPMRCFVYDPEELLSADGYRLLGYVFGEWGSLAYYSWYMGAPVDYPPTLPVPLVAQRLGAQRVRLRWSPSIKYDRGGVEYRLRIFQDRARTRQIASATTAEPHHDWDVPEMNRHYFYDVCAMDDHREKNAQTWYPAVPGNFVLVPKEQYGWYGVL
jgi:hypothetical protein